MDCCSTSEKSLDLIETDEIMQQQSEDSHLSNDTIGYVLSHTPPIVEHILQHLPVQILNTCSQVCKLWSSIVQVIKRRRRNVFWLFKVHVFGELQDDDEAPDPNREIYATNDPLDLGDHLYEHIYKAPCEPQLGFLFCMERFAERPHKYFSYYPDPESSKSQKKRLNLWMEGKSERLLYHIPAVEYISTELPRTCRLVSCVTSGIVGTPINGSVPVEFEMAVGYTSVFFPSIPGMETFQFSITEQDMKNTPLGGRKNKLEAATISKLTGIPEDKNIKCLVVFLEDLPKTGGLCRTVLEHYLNRQNFQFALGGAFVDQVSSPLKERDSTSQVATGVAFAGDNVRAASLVLEPSVRKPEQVLEKLAKLKACNFPDESSIAFMFACCGRGVAFYGRSNVEAECFRKVFPKVPLFGLFGNGEIGINYLPNSTPEDGDTGINQPPNSTAGTRKGRNRRDSQSTAHWFHGYTTIFILLSWSKK